MSRTISQHLDEVKARVESRERENARTPEIPA